MKHRIDRHPAARKGLLLAALAAAALGLPGAAMAHGIVGKRFFPATIATDDPFVADELALPTVSSVRTSASDDGPAARQTTVSGEFAKTLTPRLGLSIGLAHDRVSSAGEPVTRGFENVELGLKYLVYRNDASESLLSAGIGWEIPGSGSRAVREPVGSYTPALFFGQGLGALPDRYAALRPLAITGSLGVAVPTRSSTTSTRVDPDTGALGSEVQRHPHVLQVGLALQYSLPYLQSFVKDVGLGAPFDRMIPVVEFTAQKPLDRVDERRWTGTVNPGVLWAGRKVQLGVEAIVPMNGRSGRGVGAQVQLHFFLDDIFPASIGRPLFGSAS